jgi:hypothetical protein
MRMADRRPRNKFKVRRNDAIRLKTRPGFQGIVEGSLLGVAVGVLGMVGGWWACGIGWILGEGRKDVSGRRCGWVRLC